MLRQSSNLMDKQTSKPAVTIQGDECCAGGSVGYSGSQKRRLNSALWDETAKASQRPRCRRRRLHAKDIGIYLTRPYGKKQPSMYSATSHIPRKTKDFILLGIWLQITAGILLWLSPQKQFLFLRDVQRISLNSGFPLQWSSAQCDRRLVGLQYFSDVQSLTPHIRSSSVGKQGTLL